jgi:hypothetical protein
MAKGHRNVKRSAPPAEAQRFVPFGKLTTMGQKYRLGFRFFIRIMMRDAVAAFLERDKEFRQDVAGAGRPGKPLRALGFDFAALGIDEPATGVRVLSHPVQTSFQKTTLAGMVTRVFEHCYQGAPASHPYPEEMKAWKQWLDYMWSGQTIESTMMRLAAR